MFKQNSYGEVMVDRETFLSWIELLGKKESNLRVIGSQAHVEDIKLSNGVMMRFNFTLLDVQKNCTYYGRESAQFTGGPGYNFIRFGGSRSPFNLFGKGKQNPETWSEARELIDLLKQ